MPSTVQASLKSVRRMPAPKTFPKIGGGNLTRDLDLAQDELVALLDLTQQVKSMPGALRAIVGGTVSELAV